MIGLGLSRRVNHYGPDAQADDQCRARDVLERRAALSSAAYHDMTSSKAKTAKLEGTDALAVIEYVTPAGTTHGS